MKRILVTDTLFIFPEHEAKLRAAGFTVDRLAKPYATEAELLERIMGASAYIHGGAELLTDKVIAAADKLEAIVCCGSDYKPLIPGWQTAMQRGIAIANMTDSHAQAVAEWALTLTLAMTRGVFEVSRVNDVAFQTTHGLCAQTIGILGLGRIGTRIAQMLTPFQPKEVLYFSKHRHAEAEKQLGVTPHKLPDVLKRADVLFVCLPSDVGLDFLTQKHLALMKPGALVLSFGEPGIINTDALFDAIQAGGIRGASDCPLDKRFNTLPLASWYSNNDFNAFNTHAGLEQTSDTVVETVINLLTSGADPYRVQ